MIKLCKKNNEIINKILLKNAKSLQAKIVLIFEGGS